MRSSSFYGRAARDYRSSRFRLAESTYVRETLLPLHSHANAHFCLVLSGSYTERLGERTVRRGPGDLIFYGPRVGHAEHHHAPGRHFMIELDAELGSAVGRDGARAWISERGATRTVATRLFGEFRRDGRVSERRLTELVERLVEQALRGPADEPARPWLAEVERRLRELGEGSPDLERLAREVGVHPVYLGRAFREAYGCAPGEYLRRLRVERAQRALAGDGGIADVALDSGFCDQSHLNRVFKKQTGLTPGHYRRLVAARGPSPSEP